MRGGVSWYLEISRVRNMVLERHQSITAGGGRNGESFKQDKKGEAESLFTFRRRGRMQEKRKYPPLGILGAKLI